MRIAKITQDKVFKVADQLQAKSIKPTVAKVHEKIGGGSTTTVHKYLSLWKEQNVGGLNLNPAKLQAELAEKLKIIENLSCELCNSTALAASESAKNAKLEARVLELEGRLDEKAQANLELARRNTQSETSLKSSFDSMVAILGEQLRAINLQAIQKVQEAGQHFYDQVMSLKLELRALKEQLASKDKELKNLNEQLNSVTLEGSSYGV